MAQLKDTLIQGSARVTDTLFTNILNVSGAGQVDTFKITNTTAVPHLKFSRSDYNYIAVDDGASLIIANGATMGTAYALLSANKLAVYNAYGATLGTSNYYWGNTYIKGYVYTKATTKYPLDIFIHNKAGNQVGEIWYEVGDVDNVTTGAFRIRQFSPKSTAAPETNGTHETYYLPTVATGLATNQTYNIITTKNLTSITRAGSPLNLKPETGEGGQLNLHASTANTNQAGITLDQLNSQLRIFGIASADGTTKTGTGTPLVIDPYAKTITGGYTITGTLSGNATNVSGTVAVNHGGTGATSFTADCVIVGNGTNAMASCGLKVTGSTTADILLTSYTDGKSMTIGPTTGALNLQTNGTSGGNIYLQAKGTSGNVTIAAVNGNITVGPTGTGTLTLKTTNAAANLTITSGNVLYLDSGSSAAHVFRRGTTEDARFNGSGKFQLGDNGSQSTHKLYVNGDSAFNGKLAFGAQSSNTITENASIQYDATLNAIKFVFDPNAAVLTYASGISF